MANAWKKIDGYANRLLTWAGVISLLTAVFSWISSHLAFLQPYGWAETFFVGLLAALTLVLAITGSLAMWRIFRPLMPRQSATAVIPGISISERDSILETGMRELEAKFKAEALNEASELKDARRQVNILVGAKARTDADTLQLLDWAASRASSTVVKNLLIERPVTDKFSPPTDDKARGEILANIRGWISKVLSSTQSVNFGREIYQTVHNAPHDGDVVFRQLSLETHEGRSISVLEFRDYFVACHQCDCVAEQLEYVVRELDRFENSSVDRLRERIAMRKAQPS